MSAARRAGQRGVSLIEALVALAVMAIGMLGLVGVQASLRSNSDLAKQRSEAVRLAQWEIERWRAFTVLGASGGTGYGDLVDGTVTEADVTAGIAGSNASFTRVRKVETLAAPRQGKALSVEVTWADRGGTTQRVQMATLIAGVAPELAATLAVPGSGDLVRQPKGRNRGIPLLAKDLGNGSSAMKPPGAAADVAWKFDNVTGLITLCTTTAATTGDLTEGPGGTITSCSTDKRMLLSGFLRYAVSGGVQPTESQARNPTDAPLSLPPAISVAYTNAGGGNVTCLAGNGGTTYTSYYCAIPVLLVPGVTPIWSGTLSFANNGTTVMAATASETSSSMYRACRYHSAASYTSVNTPLANQNYLFIKAGNVSPGGSTSFTCPTPTLLHQPTAP